MTRDRAALTLAHEQSALSGDTTATAFYDAALERLDVAERCEPTHEQLIDEANKLRQAAIESGSAVDHAIADLAVRRIVSSAEAKAVVERVKGRRK